MVALLLDARSFYEKVDLLQLQQRATRDNVHHPAKTPRAYMEPRASRRPAHISSSKGAARREPAAAAACKRRSIIAMRMFDDALLAEWSKRCVTARNADRGIWSQAVLRELRVS